ncbi:hypothetical protein JMJ35_010635 [Cladonia borealis]|uniref:Cytochrome P450 n=1 Tax=Cladonia borealis TaxID=184061 RepID=A0AA39QPW1_9LECA|nr:hypothetical protein JMJ35_010635 [Cladonia borealis]
MENSKLIFVAPYLALGCALYFIALVIYRLYFSPVAHFPGSKLTAATGWIETYYDVFKGGQFTFQLQKWHEQYGPIIRINPDEIHVSDPDFYDVAYASSAPFEKMPKWRDRFGLPGAVQSTVQHELHRSRRMTLNPHFSKKAISNFSWFIQQRMDQLCDRLLREFKDSGEVVTLNDAWGAVTADIIINYCLGFDYNFVGYPGFVAPFTRSIKELALSVHIAGHFPWFLKLLQSSPDWLVGLLNPGMKPVFNFQNEIKKQITIIKESDHEKHSTERHKTVFADILSSNLPRQEKTVARLQDEATGVVAAAIETTKTTLSVASFHILHNPGILRRLRIEWREAIFSDPEKPTCYGVAQRLPRVSKYKAIQYDTYSIPPNTPFSMSSYIQHTSSVFNDCFSFSPDRWLTTAKVASAPGREEKSLDRFFVPFSKGTRWCLGQNLAWAQLYIGLSALFRRVDLELFETEPEAISSAREYFITLPPPETKGIRVIVK